MTKPGMTRPDLTSTWHDEEPDVTTGSVRSSTPDLAEVVLRLQSEGLRLGVRTEGRKGGAGPSDVGMIWVEDLALTVHAHPTLPETLMEAAEATLGHAIHIFQRKSPAQQQAPARV